MLLTVQSAQKAETKTVIHQQKDRKREIVVWWWDLGTDGFFSKYWFNCSADNNLLVWSSLHLFIQTHIYTVEEQILSVLQEMMVSLSSYELNSSITHYKVLWHWQHCPSPCAYFISKLLCLFIICASFFPCLLDMPSLFLFIDKLSCLWPSFTSVCVSFSHPCGSYTEIVVL